MFTLGAEALNIQKKVQEVIDKVEGRVVDLYPILKEIYEYSEQVLDYTALSNLNYIYFYKYEVAAPLDIYTIAWFKALQRVINSSTINFGIAYKIQVTGVINEATFKLTTEILSKFGLKMMEPNNIQDLAKKARAIAEAISSISGYSLTIEPNKIPIDIIPENKLLVIEKKFPFKNVVLISAILTLIYFIKRY